MVERTIPILPSRDIDETVVFYEALGFVVTYRQARPNPYLAMQRGSLDLHFFALEGFDPETSMGTAIVLVHDPGALFDAFAAGLRSAFGKVPIAGIPPRPSAMRQNFVGSWAESLSPIGSETNRRLLSRVRVVLIHRVCDERFFVQIVNESRFLTVVVTCRLQVLAREKDLERAVSLSVGIVLHEPPAE